MKQFKKIKDLVKSGEEFIVVDTIGDYSLIYRHSSYQPWVAAFLYVEKEKSWSQGEYFQQLKDALLYILMRENKDDIVECVLEACGDEGCDMPFAEIFMEEEAGI